MKGITQINDLNLTSTNNILVHDTKNLSVTMVDKLKNKNISCSPQDCCWWCRHTFTGHPIGCPLRYESKTIIKTFTSDVSKEHFVLEQPIPSDEKIDDNNVTTKDAYYETEGFFCSFNCCKAYIEEQLYNSRVKHYYKESLYLLSKLYYDMNDKYPDKFVSAPSWKLLTEYGGYMNITEFRNGFNVNCYTHKGFLGEMPQQKTLGSIFEETYLF